MTTESGKNDATPGMRGSSPGSLRRGGHPIQNRFLAALGSWALLFVASPGILSREGSAAIALVALTPWTLFCSRPGPRAFLVEWLAAAVGFSALTFWSTFVWWGTLLAVAIVPAFYVALAGALLRRLARSCPLALAAPAAWVALETLRALVEPPFGFGWLRLGHYFHATDWLAGSARAWGTGGLSWTAAAFAGGIADWLATRFDRSRGRPVVATALALGPLALAAVISRATSAPATVAGPRVMLVQPAFEQRRKMERTSARDLFRDSVLLTAHGLAEVRRDGETTPDLVAWGETMLPTDLADLDLLEAWDRGARPVAWGHHPIERDDIVAMNEIETRWIRGDLFGRRGGDGRGVLPEGTSFLSGVELHTADKGDIRRRNAIVLWDARGSRAGVGGKIHLVPGAESLCGLERLAWVRELAYSIAGYVPDIQAFERTSVLELEGRGGRRWHLGVSVCFDNAYDDPYTEPLRRGALDFHLVCSNEAWYRESFEYDQMVAFSRIIAIETGRTVVRATNAGISIVIGPDGREVARLASGGKDRMIAGTLRATVPVPASDRPIPPFYVRSERVWLAAWVIAPLLLALAVRRRGYSSSAVG